MKYNKFIISFLLFCAFSLQSLAMEVTKIKDTKVLIDSGTQTLNEGDNYLLMSAENKRIALIKISKAKPGKAIAEVIKGTPSVGATLVKVKQTSAPPPPTPSTTETASNDTEATTATKTAHKKRKHTSDYAFGGLLGYAKNSLNMTVNNGIGGTASGTFSGTSISFKAFADYNYTPDFSFRVATGLEPFNVSGDVGTNICGSNSTSVCQASYNYLPLEFSAHYNFYNQSAFKPWVGLGYSYLISISSSVNIPNLNSGGTNQTVLISLGSNYQLANSNYFIPAVIEYALFPGSSGVTSNVLYLRGGFGWNF